MPRYFLQVLRDGQVLTTTRLADTPVVVGRAVGCDLQLDSEGVSRRHAELFRLGDDWVVRDLGSRNGVVVNGVRIVRDQAVQPGDRVQIDVFDLALQRERTRVPQAPRVAPAPPLVESGYGVVRTIHQMPAPRLAAQHLSTLLEFSGGLLVVEAVSERRRRLCELMIGDAFHGTAAMLLRVRHDEVSPELLAGPALAGRAVAPQISSAVLRAVVAGETAVLAASSPSALDSNEVVKMSTDAGARVAAVACPVEITAEHLDILYVTLPGVYGTAEWLALAAMAAALFHQADEVWAARQAAQARLLLEDEMRRAQALQMRLVPRDFVAGQIDIGFGFAPCKGVGGDYVDAVRMGDGRLLLVAMDVAGKGMDAALIASGLHTTVHVCAAHDFTLAAMIATLNNYLMATWEDSTSVTVAASILDLRTGALESINCSHPAPLIVGRGGATRELAAFDVIPLGLAEFDIETSVDQLRPGEMLAYFSDGLSELFNADDIMLGPDGVADCIREIRGGEGQQRRSSELVTRLYQRLADYRGEAPPSDDVSFILAQASGS